MLKLVHTNERTASFYHQGRSFRETLTACRVKEYLGGMLGVLPRVQRVEGTKVHVVFARQCDSAVHRGFLDPLALMEYVASVGDGELLLPLATNGLTTDGRPFELVFDMLHGARAVFLGTPMGPFLPDTWFAYAG